MQIGRNSEILILSFCVAATATVHFVSNEAFAGNPSELADSIASESTPDSVVLKAISAVKSEGDVSKTYDFIDWNTAFELFKAKQFKINGIENGEDLKQEYVDIITGVPMRKISMTAKLLPHGQRENYLKAHLPTSAVKPMNNPKYVAQLYEIKKSTQDGLNASVTLLITGNGATQSREVKLSKSSGQWLMVCPGLMDDDPFALCD